MKLQAHGIETDLPVGWEGRIALRTPPTSPSSAEIADGDASVPREREVSSPGEAARPGPTDTSVMSDAAPFTTLETPEGTDVSEGLETPNHPDAPDTPVAPDASDAPVDPDARSAVLAGPVEPSPDVEQHFPVAHLANFPLPEGRGDFGSGAVDIMTADDVLMVLAEFGPECVNTALFAPRDLPTNLTPNMFSGSALQRSHQGQAGCQIFFTHANRAFCLYTVLGRQSSAARVLPQANATLAATRIAHR